MSARAIYLLLATVIILLFGATGVFYYFNIYNQPSTPPQTQQVVQASPSPSPSAEPVSIYNQEFEPMEATESAEADTASYACYEACEFSFQCSDQLSCLDVNGQKRCVNEECPDNSTCVCSAAQTPDIMYTAQAEINLTEVGGGDVVDTTPTPLPTVTATPRPTATATPRPTATPTPTQTPSTLASAGTGGTSTSPTSTSTLTETEEYNPELPEAGTENLTLIILLAGLASSSAGLAWLKLRS